MRRPCADREEKRVIHGRDIRQEEEEQLDSRNPNQRRQEEEEQLDSRNPNQRGLS
jgi:hypothetical protein